MADLLFYDRSRVSLDWKCPRARWWGNEWEGLGVVPMQRMIYFDIGDAYHKAVAALKCREDLEEVVGDAVGGFREALRRGNLLQAIEEQSCLVEGLIRGYARQVLPPLLAEFDLVGVEEEFLHPHGQCVQGVRPDSLFERKSDKTLWYMEEKTASSLGTQWMQQWAKAIQLHTTALAVEHHIGREVQGIIVQGAYKGYVKDGKQSSIFCYGYARPGLTGGPDVYYQWKTGAKRTPVWEMKGGCRRWVEEMPEEVLSAQFVQAPPVFLQRRLVEAFLRQQERREMAIEDAGMEIRENPVDDLSTEELLDDFFPQHFDQCAPAMGSPCPYTNLCYNPHMGADPLQHGYTRRVPHHATDLRGLARLKELTES